MIGVAMFMTTTTVPSSTQSDEQRVSAVIEETAIAMQDHGAITMIVTTTPRLLVEAAPTMTADLADKLNQHTPTATASPPENVDDVADTAAPAAKKHHPK